MSGPTTATNMISTPGAHQATGCGKWDAFLVKFNPGGVRQWGTYYGGNEVDEGYSCNADLLGNVYLSGNTESNMGITTPGAHRTTFAGPREDSYLIKFNGNGVRQWGTYYGGMPSSCNEFESCSVDLSGNVYLLGFTNVATGIATPSAFQDSFASAYSTQDFLVKFNTNGIRDWGTYIRGLPEACATDAFGNLYLSGRAGDSVLSTSGAYQTTPGNLPGYSDAFLIKFTECSNYLTINTQPQDQQIVTGHQAQFIVATSKESVTFQWQTDTEMDSRICPTLVNTAV